MRPIENSLVNDDNDVNDDVDDDVVVIVVDDIDKMFWCEHWYINEQVELW